MTVVRHSVQDTARSLRVDDSSDYLSVCGWLTEPHESESVFLADESNGWTSRTYRQVAADAHAVAQSMLRAGLSHGDGVCIVLPTDFDCVAALFGAWSAGAVVTMVVPPSLGNNAEYVSNLDAVLRRASPRLVLTTASLESFVAPAVSAVPNAGPVMIVDTSPPIDAEEPLAPQGHATTDLALVQFTSGSSGTPKGVPITWGNLAANLVHIAESIAWREGDSTVSWLPLYHDMGLVGGLLTTVAKQGDLYLMRPDQFIRDPSRWVRAMSTTRHSVTPSFGLAYTARRVRPEELEGVDLGEFRSLIVGAEPVDPVHAAAFSRLLAGTGFTESALRPAYGLAESTLLASVNTLGTLHQLIRVDGEALRMGYPVRILDRASGLSSEATGPGWIVGLGGSSAHSTVRIADAEGESLAEGILGEVVVSGDSVAHGYFGDSEQDSAASGSDESTRFVDGELRSGDAGFITDGVLYVLGRMGSSVKVRGRHVFMEDVDGRVARATGIAKHRLAAVALTGSPSTSGIALIVEREAGDWIEPARTILRSDLGPAHRVVIVTGRRGLIQRTSSGKPRRRRMAELLQAGELTDAVAVHETGAPAVPRPAEVFGDRRPSLAMLGDSELAALLDAALNQVDLPKGSAILLEGSIAEGFGNDGSDIDFLAVSPGSDSTPVMPTVLFIGGRRVEVRTRSEAELIAQARYVRASVSTDTGDDSALLETNQDVLNRCQRFTRAAVLRPGTVDIEAVRNELPESELAAVLAGWWSARARQSLRRAVAARALHDGAEAVAWTLDGLVQAVKGWAAGRGETYIESKWLTPQLDRIADAEVSESYASLDRRLRRSSDLSEVSTALELASRLGVDVPDDDTVPVLVRAPGVTSWPVDGRIHVLRNRSEIFVLSERASRAWRTVVFGRSIDTITGNWQEPMYRELAEFVRLGFVGTRWGRNGVLRPATAMVKPLAPYSGPPSGGPIVVGLSGGVRTDRPVTLLPLPASRFAECASALVWANIIVENSREDLIGALAHGQSAVAQVAADRYVKGAIRMTLSIIGCSPLPPDVAPLDTLDRLLPDSFPDRTELMDDLRGALSVSFDEPAAEDSAGALAVLDKFVERVRTSADMKFPASFDSQDQWRATLEIAYDWVRLAAFLDAELPIDEVQDLLTSGGVQPHQRHRDPRGENK